MNHKLTDGIIKANAALKCINLMGLQILHTGNEHASPVSLKVW